MARRDLHPPGRRHARAGWGPPRRRATCPSRAETSPVSRSLPHSKLLHKRDNDKVDAQEENFLPKYQRVKDLCQRAEYQTACEQLGQVSKHAGTLGAERYPSALPSQWLSLQTTPQACSAALWPAEQARAAPLRRGILLTCDSQDDARWYR